MTIHLEQENGALKKILIGSILSTLFLIFLLFIFIKPSKSQDTLDYEGNHYYGTAYITDRKSVV